MLLTFRVRSLHRSVRPVSSRLSVAGSPNSYLDGVVRISALEYDRIISAHPDAKLKYIDEDDGEIVTVGSSLELMQRLEDPMVSAKLKLRSMPVTKATWPGGLKHSAGSPPLHLFEIESQENSGKVWQDIVRKSEPIRISSTFQEPRNSEYGVPNEFNELKAPVAFEPSESFRLQAHSMEQMASSRNYKPLRINTHVEDPTPQFGESLSPFLKRFSSEEVLSPYMGPKDWENLAASPICYKAPPSPYIEYNGYEDTSSVPLYPELLSPYLNENRPTQIAKEILHGLNNPIGHSQFPGGSADHVVVPGNLRSSRKPPQLPHPSPPACVMRQVEQSKNTEPETQSQSEQQSSLLQLFEAELARLWKNPGRSDFASRSISEIYGDEHHDSTTVEKVQQCVEKLKDLGFGENGDGGVQRLVVYAQAAEGNLSDAIDLIDEEQRAYKEWASY